jgi:hypothetical protein
VLDSILVTHCSADKSRELYRHRFIGIGQRFPWLLNASSYFDIALSR